MIPCRIGTKLGNTTALIRKSVFRLAHDIQHLTVSLPSLYSAGIFGPYRIFANSADLIQSQLRTSQLLFLHISSCLRVHKLARLGHMSLIGPYIALRRSHYALEFRHSAMFLPATQWTQFNTYMVGCPFCRVYPIFNIADCIPL